MKPYQNRDWLYQGYIIEDKSITQISKEIKCADTTIRTWLKKFGIPIRTNSESKIGKRNHQWKGGETIDQEGRVLVRKPSHPHVRKNGYVFRSHIVMEKILGRYLKPEEVVHHKNKILDDDRPENLELFISKSEHISFHFQQRRNKNK